MKFMLAGVCLAAALVSFPAQAMLKGLDLCNGAMLGEKVTDIVMRRQADRDARDLIARKNLSPLGKKLLKILEATSSIPRLPRQSLTLAEAAHEMSQALTRWSAAADESVSAVQALLWLRFDYVRGPMGRPFKSRSGGWAFTPDVLADLLNETVGQGLLTPSQLAIEITRATKLLEPTLARQLLDVVDVFVEHRGAGWTLRAVVDTISEITKIKYFAARRQTRGGGSIKNVSLTDATRLLDEALENPLNTIGAVMVRAMDLQISNRNRTLPTWDELEDKLVTLP